LIQKLKIWREKGTDKKRRGKAEREREKTD